MKTLLFSIPLLVAVSLQAQLPTASPKAAGFDPARLDVLHAMTKRFVDEGQHAGLITLLACDGKIVEDQPIVETWPEVGRAIEAGGAGVFSTAGDFVRFAQMLRNGGTLEGKRSLGRQMAADGRGWGK